ncbi:MAG: AAA family ATPase [Lachnospiraceae bacterium]|nr:AAA family ATPase [Lachnospiraceae bacterium]
MQVTQEVAEILNKTLDAAVRDHYEYVTPELLLYMIAESPAFQEAFEGCGGDVRQLSDQLKTYLDDSMERLEEAEHPSISAGLQSILVHAQETAENSGKGVVELAHLVHALYSLEESYAVYYLELQGIDRIGLLQELTVIYEEKREKRSSGCGQADERPQDGSAGQEAESGRNQRWRSYVTCLNDNLDGINPLIGREKELERTMQILCRKEKNNPLHLGEPGVGKTAIVYGLARLLNEGRVPEPLRGAKIYALDMGSLLAGTQYRGDFEKRFRLIMDGISGEEKPIVYMDEIHNIVGAGAVGEGSFDVSNMLKPYLASGKIRFIGATTYEEYKKHFEKSKSLVRRFQNVEIKEPGIEDTVRILEGLKKTYEAFHGVRYGKGVLEYAVRMSDRYINERYLPDKAIDLMDEAGAYRRMHPLDQKTQTVNKSLIDEILSNVCRIPKQTVEADELKNLASLEKRMSARVFGQDDAIAQVVNAVKFSRAGLLEDGKPLANLLFVGPTGVGKTEIARSLAAELGVPLLRFDMSEYEEKHAVAKLIGSPAGYIGYEDGGLLTEQVRKNPHAVLLLDEIEKAHPDIYNILLQVMDYATLTDNQGRKADFRNVILIMTSNAGASRVGKPGIGFGDRDIKSDVIIEEVKKTFQPEFRNRLNRIVVFRHMDHDMAMRIAEKKLTELKTMLAKKNVELSVLPEAKELLIRKGTSTEYGAREMERIISGEIKPLLVDAILFGSLKRGGVCRLSCRENGFMIEKEKKGMA